MLNPKNDRLDYGSILTPPTNYKLDFAIGSSYSLNLDSLIGTCIPLGLSEETDSELISNPIFLFEALRRTSEKIVLFCEGGQIHTPSKPTKLYILLDETIFPTIVSHPKETQYSSFHPKMWLIRYIDENETPLYRIIVLSRNLTFDRSWDISFTMDGEKTGKTKENIALIKFIEYIKKSCDNTNKVNKIQTILDELPYIKFKLKSKDFYSFDFIPNGINDKYSIQNYPLFKDSFDELLIISPFLSNNVIKDFNSRISKNGKGILITEPLSLGKLNPKDCDNFEIYTLKDQISDGESLISEDIGETKKQNIHAKMYMTKKDNEANLYLGSLNSTYNSLNGNIEFMIRLRSKNNSLNIEKLTKDLFNGEKGGPDSPFQLIDISKIIKEDGNQNNLDKIIKSINKSNPKAKIIKKANNQYDMELNINHPKTEDDVYIKPLLSNKSEKLSKHIVFRNLNKLQLSQFIVVSVSNSDEKLERIIKVSVEGMPDNREKDLINSIVNDEKSFIDYISFLLGDNFILSAIESLNSNSKGLKSNFNIPSMDLYEKMLKAAYYEPKRFDEISFLIKTIEDEDIIPEGFEELYNTFKKVVD